MTEEIRVPAWKQAMARAGLVSVESPKAGQDARVIAGPRHPRVPDLKELDMMFNWSVHQSGGRAVARTECAYIEDTELAMDFTVRAFAYHGWEIESGGVLWRGDTWAVSLVFIHPKLKHGRVTLAGKKKVN